MTSTGPDSWSFEWDEDSLIAQAREGLPEDMEAVYVGCLPIEIDGMHQEVGRHGMHGAGDVGYADGRAADRRGAAIWVQWQPPRRGRGVRS